MKSNWYPLKRFIQLLNPEKKDIRNIYFYAIFQGLVNLSVPLGIQAIISFVQGAQMVTSWGVLVFIVVLGVTVVGVLQIMQMRLSENIQQRLFTKAAFEFGYRIPRIKAEVLFKNYAPELMNRFFDVLSVQKGLSKILVDFSSAILQVVFGVVLLSFYHPFFSLFGLLLLVLLFILFKYTGVKGLRTSLAESKHKYKVVHWLEEIARNHLTFKNIGQSDLYLDKIDGSVSKYINARESHFKVLVKQFSYLVLFKVIITAGLLAIGGLLVIEQQMNIGQFVAAEIIIILLLNSVEKLIISTETIYDVLTSVEKIGQVTDLELEAQDGFEFTPKHNEGIALNIKNLGHKGSNSNQYIFKEVNLDVGAGERVIVEGGSTTTTNIFLNLISGLYQIQEGAVLYNGLTNTSLEVNSLRANIGSAFNTDGVFEGTFLENIVLGRDGIDMDRVCWVVKELGLDPFLESLPNGYATELKPEGLDLPKSVVKKIVLARAIVSLPELLVLEEPLNYISEEERQKLMTFLTSHSWTLIMSSSQNNIGEYFDSKFSIGKEKVNLERAISF